MADPTPDSTPVNQPAARRPRRALVLGGSGYVGSAVCRALVAAEVRVAFTWWRNEGAANALAADLPGSVALQVDLSRYADVHAVVAAAAEKLGGLDVLVQCAGLAGDPLLYQTDSGRDKFLSITGDGWDEMLDITARSTFAACQAAARAMAANADAAVEGGTSGNVGGNVGVSVGGEIVIVGSMDGVKSVPAPVHYASGKGALRAMVQALAKELGKRKIRINMVAPGILDGGLARLLSDDLLQEYLKHCSMKRTGSAAEIAEFVAWLATENTYVTGQSIVLDGGL